MSSRPIRENNCQRFFEELTIFIIIHDISLVSIRFIVRYFQTIHTLDLRVRPAKTLFISKQRERSLNRSKLPAANGSSYFNCPEQISKLELLSDWLWPRLREEWMNSLPPSLPPSLPCTLASWRRRCLPQCLTRSQYVWQLGRLAGGATSQHRQGARWELHCINQWKPALCSALPLPKSD